MKKVRSEKVVDFGSKEAAGAFPTAEELVRSKRGEMTVDEAARVLKVSRQRVHVLLKEGKLSGREIKAPGQRASLCLISAVSVSKRLEHLLGKSRRQLLVKGR